MSVSEGDRVRVLPSAKLGQVVETDVERSQEVEGHNRLFRMPFESIGDQRGLLVRYDWKPGGGVNVADQPDTYIVVTEEEVRLKSIDSRSESLSSETRGSESTESTTSGDTDETVVEEVSVK